MSGSYNNRVPQLTHPRLENLLASLVLNLADEAQEAMERTSGLAGRATQALLALDEFLGGTHVGRLAEVLGLTHSGAVRLVSQLESHGLALRSTGADRRRVQVALTRRGRRRAAATRAARDAVIQGATLRLDDEQAVALEQLLEQLVVTKVAARMERRLAGDTGAWWCRTCAFAACGRPQGRCPAQATAARTARQ